MANDSMTAAEYEALRSEIESDFNGQRDAREKQLIADREAMMETYHKDIHDNRVAKEQALVAAGLNPDGSDPQGRVQGSTL